MLKVSAYCDGSCLGNPGVGGWAGTLEADRNGKRGKRTYVGNTTKNTTNNRAELEAVLAGLVWLNTYQKEPCDITFNVDSDYVIKVMRLPANEVVCTSRKNHDLIVQIIQETIKGGHKCTFNKVEAHSDDERNREVDLLARAQAKKARHERYGR